MDIDKVMLPWQSSFASSPSKINVGEIFKMLAPETVVRVLQKQI